LAAVSPVQYRWRSSGNFTPAVVTLHKSHPANGLQVTVWRIAVMGSLCNTDGDPAIPLLSRPI